MFSVVIPLYNKGQLVQRAYYLECMKSFRNNAEPLVDFFFDVSISRMTSEIEQKQSANDMGNVDFN